MKTIFQSSDSKIFATEDECANYEKFCLAVNSETDNAPKEGETVHLLWYDDGSFPSSSFAEFIEGLDISLSSLWDERKNWCYIARLFEQADK